MNFPAASPCPEKPRYMSFHYTALAFECRIAAPDKTVLLYIARHANDEGECWPSQEAIAGQSGLGKSTVLRAIKRLVKSGILTVKRRGNKFGGSNRYVLDAERMNAFTVESYSEAVKSKTAISVTLTPSISVTVTPALVSQRHPNREGNREEEQRTGSKNLEITTGCGPDGPAQGNDEDELPGYLDHQKESVFLNQAASFFPAELVLPEQAIEESESIERENQLCFSPQLTSTPPKGADDMPPIFDQGAPATLCAHLAQLLGKRAYPDWTAHAETILKAGTLDGAMAIATWAIKEDREGFWRVKLTGMAGFARFIAKGAIIRQWQRAGSPGATKTMTKAVATPRNTTTATSITTTQDVDAINALLHAFPMFNTAARVAGNFLSDSNTRAVVSPASDGTGRVELYPHGGHNFIALERIAYAGSHAWKLPKGHGLAEDVATEVISAAKAAWNSHLAGATEQTSAWVN
jgi:DNA-binding transcriptional regulator YhcF (GntR family)